MNLTTLRQLLLLAFIALPAFAQHFEGTISTPGTPLAIEVDVDGANATITIPAQNIRRWALTKVVFDAATFSADMPNVISLHVADRVLGFPPKDWSRERLARRDAAKAIQKTASAKKATTRKNAPASHPLGDYAGDYNNPGYGTLHIARDGEALKATYNGIITPIEHWHYDVWSALKGDDTALQNLKFKFETDFDGNVASVEVPFEPAVAAAVFAKKPDAKYSDPDFLKRYAGKYMVGPTPMTVDMRGDHLVISAPGQTPRKLVPAIDGWFDLEGLSGCRAQFNGDTMSLSQPNGLFEAKRQ